uniref:uncharacterized protein LOC100177081 isoform X3 n=1 Tax=Ciona intestinalis TaxID=7719 RepID=UPI000EF527B6|nr:uncharacterized protein LOC100177081 isoform X3 [Ciona intestinalis]|eukprot:XP_026691388.1 uncharacterized protein LOC100177081 isoform X3 [Ciona intestinalis]
MENTSKDSGFNTESPSSSLDSEEQFINWSEDESAPDSESEFNRQRRRDLLDVLVEIVLKQRRGNRHERERARRRRRHRRHLYERNSRSRPDTPEPLMKVKFMLTLAEMLPKPEHYFGTSFSARTSGIFFVI